jgi:hypothetical protein
MPNGAVTHRRKLSACWGERDCAWWARTKGYRKLLTRHSGRTPARDWLSSRFGKSNGFRTQFNLGRIVSYAKIPGALDTGIPENGGLSRKLDGLSRLTDCSITPEHSKPRAWSSRPVWFRMPRGRITRRGDQSKTTFPDVNSSDFQVPKNSCGLAARVFPMRFPCLVLFWPNAASLQPRCGFAQPPSASCGWGSEFELRHLCGEKMRDPFLRPATEILCHLL